MENSINIAEVSNIIGAMEFHTKYGHLDVVKENAERLNELWKLLPSGSGIDSGVTFDDAKSEREKLVFTFGFHHLNEVGYYDGWTFHKLIVKPSFMHGFTLSITGSDRNRIKDYLHDVFQNAFYIDTQYMMKAKE